MRADNHVRLLSFFFFSPRHLCLVLHSKIEALVTSLLSTFNFKFSKTLKVKALLHVGMTANCRLPFFIRFTTNPMLFYERKAAAVTANSVFIVCVK